MLGRRDTDGLSVTDAILRVGAAGGESLPLSSILASKFHLSDCPGAELALDLF
jgi:hypothetical protein